MKFNQITLALSSLFDTYTGSSNFTADPFPAPTHMRWASSAVHGPVGLSSDLRLEAPQNDVLQAGFDRTLEHIRQDTTADVYGVVATVGKVKVQIDNLDADLQQGVDESYDLEVNQKHVHIHARTVWGALYAFSTLEQLVLSGADGLMVEAPVQIQDAPKYSYRGQHIDTARNFYTIESLKRQVDALAMAKMNVFHWHLTDSQAWPVFVKSFPEMTKDAYSSREMYTIEDVRDLVGYARARGVRVIPELDMPGHSAAGWKQIDPDLLVCHDEDWQQTAVEPTPGHLNILNDNVYPVLENIYNDVSALFNDNMFHVGFDELKVGCYKSDPDTVEWAKDKSWKDLAQHWVDQTLPIFKNRENRRLMMWQDSVTSSDIAAYSIPKDVVLQAWIPGKDTVKDLTSQGYDVVVSSADFLYLDCGFGNWVGNDTEVFEKENMENDKCSYNYGPCGGSWCGPYKSWQRIYALDFESGLTDDEKKHVLGASTALWSEQTDSATVDGMLWPRSAALGELLWSGNTDKHGANRSNDLLPRILKLRERMVRRGINAAAIMPKWCLKNPHLCTTF